METDYVKSPVAAPKRGSSGLVIACFSVGLVLVVGLAVFAATRGSSVAPTLGTANAVPSPATTEVAGNTLTVGASLANIAPGTVRMGSDGKRFGTMPNGMSPTQLANSGLDFLAVSSAGRIAGYLRVTDVTGSVGVPGSTTIVLPTGTLSVYGDDGTTVLGQWSSSGSGFVATGSTAPPPSVTITTAG